MSTANNFTRRWQLVEGRPRAIPGPTRPGDTAAQAAMNVDYPGANTQVSGSAFLVSGWALDLGAGFGTGVDAVDVWAYPVGSSNAVYVGAATVGIARPDLAAYVGAQFTNCGFTLVGSIATPGTYDLAVFAHSTVSGTFNQVKVVRVTVAAPASNPRMWLDMPSVNQTTSQNLTVAGWAIDLGSPTGTGVDTIHIWAYPTSGAAPVFFGVANYGGARGDVGAYAGASRFTPSGFSLTASLPRGQYALVAFAHSTVSGAFNAITPVPITVR